MDVLKGPLEIKTQQNPHVDLLPVCVSVCVYMHVYNIKQGQRSNQVLDNSKIRERKFI